MPRGLIRVQRAGDFHFVTFSCYRRLPHLRTTAARSLFERSLETMRARYELFIAGAACPEPAERVVMPKHVHLLVSEPRRVLLAKALQALKLSVAVQSRQRPFWQRRYYDFNVYTEAKYAEKLCYMHRNPVARGLVSQPNQWAWSSFRHYATGVEGAVEIESHWTAHRRGGLPTSLRYSPNTPQAHISEARCGAPTSEEAH
jgi:putative transposase